MLRPSKLLCVPRQPNRHAASESARLLGRLGGKARVRAMAADDLSKAMSKAVASRWRWATKAERSAAASEASKAR
jgi:hypothetical protein